MDLKNKIMVILCFVISMQLNGAADYVAAFRAKIAGGWDINAHLEDGSTPLTQALAKPSYHGPEDEEDEADEDEEEDTGKFADWAPYLPEIKALIECKADVNIKDAKKVPPLLCALVEFHRVLEKPEMRKSRVDPILHLLASEADLSAGNENNCNGLMMAAQFGCFELVEAALKPGSKWLHLVNERDERKSTALIHSTKSFLKESGLDNVRCARALLAVGADESLEDEWGHDFVDAARDSKLKEFQLIAQEIEAKKGKRIKSGVQKKRKLVSLGALGSMIILDDEPQKQGDAHETKESATKKGKKLSGTKDCVSGQKKK